MALTFSTRPGDSPLLCASLSEWTARPGYADGVLEVVSRIGSAADEMSAVRLLEEAAHRLGAEVAAFVSFVREDGSHESFRFLLACDAVWCHEYEKRGWYANDPWLAYAQHHSAPIRAEDIPAGSRQQRAAVELAARYGFVSALVVPAPASGGLSRVGVLCLGVSRPNWFDGEGFIAFKLAARSLAMELHEWWIGRVKGELIANARISEEDLVLLRHERLGHGSKTIAAELGCSVASVNSRFQRLTDKLGVPNRRGAAILAAEYGLI